MISAVAQGAIFLISRLSAAIVRAIAVMILIVLPSAMLATGGADGSQIVALVAIFAGLFTLVEYSATSPSLIEFRDAPPFNRIRFAALLATVLCLSVIFRGYENPSAVTEFFRASGYSIGRAIDFPGSPVRLMVGAMPDSADPILKEKLRDAAGLAYLISIISVIYFIVTLRLQHWPRRAGTFNMWINLPTFDPTAGGDAVARLRRDGGVNILLGFLLPFLVPAVIKLGARSGSPLQLDDPQVLIWTVSAWAFLPASILMRGIAISRVAQMIKAQRQRAVVRSQQVAQSG